MKVRSSGFFPVLSSRSLTLGGIRKKVFIAEITARAFIVADSNKRRTLSRADIAKALSKSDQFDFLIDVVPRDEPFVPGVSGPGKNSKKTISGSASTKRDPVRVGIYFFFVVSSEEQRSSDMLCYISGQYTGGTRCTG